MNVYRKPFHRQWASPSLVAILIPLLLLLLAANAWATNKIPAASTRPGKTDSMKGDAVQQTAGAKTALKTPAAVHPHDTSRKLKSAPKAIKEEMESPDLPPGHATSPAKLPIPEKLVYPILRYDIPEAQRIVLDNGMVLFLLENHELPLVNISVIIRTGSAYDPPHQAGLAELACRSIRTGGTAKMTGDEIDDRLDRYAIVIGSNAEMEMVRFSMSTLRDNLETGLDLFSQMVNTPRLEPEKVRIEKELMMEGLRRLEDDPQEYAFREFRKRLYRDNPRGNQSSITSVSGITPDDLAAFHRQYFYPANMMLTVTGDINREEAVKLIMQYFPKSPSHETPPTLPAPVLQGDGRVNLVQKVTPQSIVLLGFPAPAKQSPDFYAFSILDFILGSGGFQSRIFHEIRNNLGLAYSAGSFYKARADYGVFSAYAMTKSETTVQVLEAIKAIIRSVGAEPLTPEEIRWAKKAIINNFLFSFVSAEQIAMQQLMIEYDHLAPDFLKHYRERIQRVKPTDIQRLTGQDLLPNRAIILILGDENRFDRPTDVKQPSGTGL